MKQRYERIYVKVDTIFDLTGYMHPKRIIWSDGRSFDIEAVRDFRPASFFGNEYTGDCYTVIIRGEEKQLFFEKTRTVYASRFGRWFVECPVPN